MIIFGKRVRNRYLLVGDIFLSVIAVIASYMIRLELIAIFPTYQYSMIWMMVVAAIVKPLTYYFFGIYRRLWRYASIRELVLILSAVTTATMIVSVIMIGLFAFNVFGGFPRSVLIIDWLLSMAFVGGFRFTFRVLGENSSKAAQDSLVSGLRKKWVLVVGADYAENRRLMKVLSGWGVTAEQRDGSAQAIAELVNATNIGDPYNTVIVDARGMHSDPAQLLQTAKQDRSLQSLAFVLISPPLPGDDWKRKLLDTGFAAVHPSCFCSSSLRR